MESSTIKAFFFVRFHRFHHFFFALNDIHMVIYSHRGKALIRLTLSSLIEHLEELLILFLEDLIPDRYFVVLSFKLIDLSLKNKLLSFLPSLPMLENDA